MLMLLLMDILGKRLALLEAYYFIFWIISLRSEWSGSLLHAAGRDNRHSYINFTHLVFNNNICLKELNQAPMISIKPFKFKELLARLNALIRRHQNKVTNPR